MLQNAGYPCGTKNVQRSIFEEPEPGVHLAGFPDVLMQMWAAFFAERDGELGARFGCVTPGEALASHQLFAAALQSQEQNTAVELQRP